jgi:hypothetical protein
MVREASRPVRKGKSYKPCIYFDIEDCSGEGRVPNLEARPEGQGSWVARRNLIVRAFVASAPEFVGVRYDTESAVLIEVLGGGIDWNRFEVARLKFWARSDLQGDF